MCLLYLGWTLLLPASWPLVCLTPSLPSRHFQPAPTSPLSLSHFFFHQLHCRTVCSHLQCSLLYSLSTLFPVGSICLHFLCSIKSASSLPLPVIVPIYKVPTLTSEHLPFHTSCCLFTHLPLFLLFSLCSAVA